MTQPNKSKTRKNPSATPVKQPLKPVQTPVKPQTIYTLLVKAAIFLVVVVAVVKFTDFKGYFNPDYTNDHTRWKWNAFYQFTKDKPVDVVLVGNSHLYTGINPENLSTALGANCFILASPGTTMTDVYYCLKEAIERNKPKVAVVETFGINDYTSHELKEGTLTDQFKSFSARKNLRQKLCSTPVLFSSRNYLSAWSNTVRNHNFIFEDPNQLQTNIQLNKQKQPEQTGLYLGRYIRFTSGLEDSTLMKYNTVVGFDGKKFAISREAEEFVAKTVQLCRENDVKLVFLTLPMYHRHFKYMDEYVAKVARVLEPHQPLWENQQMPYDYKAFTPECFENTVKENQHMTYYGSLVSTYKLARFIQTNLPGVLPDRSSDMEWKKLFYGYDGYFYNHRPENDGVSQILAGNQTMGGLSVKGIELVPSQQGYKQLLVKLNKTSATSMIGRTIRVVLDLNVNGKNQPAAIDVTSSYSCDPSSHYLFASQPLDYGMKAIALKEISLLN